MSFSLPPNPSERMTDITDIGAEIARRRTFAIISHPDAGKTTLTEKLLLFSGAIQMAGAVKARGEQRLAAGLADRGGAATGQEELGGMFVTAHQFGGLGPVHGDTRCHRKTVLGVADGAGGQRGGTVTREQMRACFYLLLVESVYAVLAPLRDPLINMAAFILRFSQDFPLNYIFIKIYIRS